MTTTPTGRLAPALALLLAVASGASAQDTSLVVERPTPRFGQRALAPGFTPTPFTVEVHAGGATQVESLHLGPGCRGLVDREPDFVVEWSGRTTLLRFFVRSSADVTLVVRDPSGRFRCNDDVSPGTETQPMVDAYGAPEGHYAIWIGAKTAGHVDARLFVTEDRALRP